MKNNIYDINPIYSPYLAQYLEETVTNYEDLPSTKSSNVTPTRYLTDVDKCKYCGSTSLSKKIDHGVFKYICNKCGKVSSSFKMNDLRRDTTKLGKLIRNK